MSSLSSNGQPSTRSRQANSGDRTTAQLRDIRQKQLSHVLYWRFFVNLALMLIDAAMYIIAGATVLNLRHEATPLYSSRFNFTIDSTVYLIIVACFWVWSLYVAGIYHRHVMGDGYQLNVLLVKGMVVCWVVQCAFNYFFNLGLTLTSLCLVVIAGWLLTMVERIADAVSNRAVISGISSVLLITIPPRRNKTIYIKKIVAAFLIVPSGICLPKK